VISFKRQEMTFKSILKFGLLFFSYLTSQAQLPSKLQTDFLNQCQRKTEKFKYRRSNTSEKYLSRFNKSEEKYLRKLCRINPQKADAFYKSWAQSQQRLNKKMNGDYINPFADSTLYYNPYNDSLFSAMEYTGDSLSLVSLNDYKHQLRKEDYIKEYMRQQKQCLKKLTAQTPEMQNSYKALDKDSYYFIQQLKEYDEWFKEKNKLEQYAMNAFNTNKDFNNYFQNHSSQYSGSQIASDWGKSITDLQTNTSVKELQQKSISSLTNEGKELTKEKLSEGMAKISKMKLDFPEIANAEDIPNFKPNPLKTKRTKDRLHYNLDIQFDNKNPFAPQGINLGPSIEYDLLPSSDIGLGFNSHIPFKKVNTESNNETPVTFKILSYFDQKVKNIFYINACYDYDLTSQNELNKNDFLIGCKVKYSKVKKLAPSISILYDFFHNQHTPHTQMIVYRISFTIK
jgi:hypothetical protein